MLSARKQTAVVNEGAKEGGPLVSLLSKATYLESGDRPRELLCEGVGSEGGRMGALLSGTFRCATMNREADWRADVFTNVHSIIWLILAELMCFFQRFSHACVSRAL